MARINLDDREITIIRGLFNKELKHNNWLLKAHIDLIKCSKELGASGESEADKNITKKYEDIIDNLLKIAYKFEWDFEKNKYGGED